MRKSLASLCAMLSCTLCAASPSQPGEGDLATWLIPGLERDTGIKIHGVIDAGYSRNNTSNRSERSGGLTNLPVAGYADEKFELAFFNLFIEKPLDSRYLPRATPLPGPQAQDYSFGFTLGMLYGRDGQFARTTGWDEHWGVNEPGATNAAKAQRRRQNFYAFPDLFATAYLPYGTGVSIMAGIFGPGIGYEIPPNIRIARNAFATKTYAFVTEPGTVSGIVLGTRMLDTGTSLLGGELGIVQGLNNLRDNNNSKSVLGALRWRTADMRGWIDYEFIAGDAQNSSSDDIQAPTYRLISSSAQFRQQHSLNGWFALDKDWSIGAEAVYGRQDGDGKPGTVDIVTGPGFSGAHWWGVNSSLTYQYRQDLAFSARAEHFSDPQGFALFPVSVARGAFNGITLGLRYEATRNLSLRPEIRYDWFTGSASDRPFGNGRDRQQTTATVQALYYF
jgi:hypothetical protein